MANELTPLKSNDEADDYYLEEEEEWSQTAIYAMWGGGVAVCLGMLYLFIFFLPSVYIPVARPLDGVVKVAELDVGLQVLSPKRVKELGLDKFQFIDNDKKDEDEDDYAVDEADKDGNDYEADGQEDGEDKVSTMNGVERYILIGDVHGEYQNLQRLLKKIQYNKKTDYLLLLGDFITKGPDSLKVLDWAIENNVDCILGNHEYYVLQNYAQFHNLYAPFFQDLNSTSRETHFSTRDKFNNDPEYLLAKKLQPHQVEFINKCSVIKKLGQVPFHNPEVNNGTRRSVQGAAVHAGLRWDLLADLNEQEPMDNLEMRKLLPPFYNETTDDPHAEGAIGWTKIYKNKQKALSLKDKLVVYYGHDARRGLRLGKYTRGLDSRCNAGGHLSAMIIWKEAGAKGNKVVYKEQAFQIECK